MSFLNSLQASESVSFMPKENKAKDILLIFNNFTTFYYLNEVPLKSKSLEKSQVFIFHLLHQPQRFNFFKTQNESLFSHDFMFFVLLVLGFSFMVKISCVSDSRNKNL